MLVFQQDNDLKHLSKIVQDWLASQPFQLLQWPVQSPHLNPIEHFWALFKRCLSEFTTLSKGIQKLWERVCLMYPNLSENDCMALYKSMPNRIIVVLKSKGYWTNY